MDWYKLGSDEVFELLGSNPSGLSSSFANDRLAEIGPNQVYEGKKKTAAAILFGQFKDVMIIILMAAAIISGIVGDFTDTLVILAIIALNAVIGFFQEYRAEKAIQALKKMSVTTTTTLRNGSVTGIAATELVPGDVVMLAAGNVITADMRITESVSLRIDEAALTGESQAIDKTAGPLATDDLPLAERQNMAFRGTFVTYGRGVGIVVATGMQTELGRIAKMLQGQEPLTPLQQRLASFGKKLSGLVLLICILFFVVGWIRGENIAVMLMTSISLAVAAVPEALPAVIIISLALAAKRMIRHNSLIRKLPVVETLGSVGYICTDKTGTLTKNKMEVEELFVNNRIVDAYTSHAAGTDEINSMFLLAMALNNDALVDGDTIKGDPTETALLTTAMKEHVNSGEWRRVAEIAFDADRKLMTTFHIRDNQIISFTKGAPDLLLQNCLDSNRHSLQLQVDNMARKGQRVIGFAYRYWDALPEKLLSETCESNLRFLGLAGLVDPPRMEVYDAIAQCKTAGVVPIMITGDHPLTAQAIAQRLGMIGPGDLIITGKELAAMSDENFLVNVEKIKVYARVSPEQKLRIVKTLQEKGHYVAMTGDGVNDAPSLKRANIGIAMGITGTDVSKEAAHMILMDDNFSTIVKAIREGRRVYDNILKFIRYLMTTNSGELWTILLGPVIGLPVALLPIHILWMNLVSDGLPAVALSFEKSETGIMNRPPRPPQQSVFAEGNGLHIVWVGILMAAVALGAQAFALKNGLHWQTIVLNVLCLSQMGHIMAIRSKNRSVFRIGLFTNKPLIFSVMLTLLLQFIITYTPALQPIFKTQALSLLEFLFVGAASAIVFVAVELEKLLRKK